MVPPQDDLVAIQALIANRIDHNAVGERQIAGVIGDAPSQYSKSPALWNAAFRRLGMAAVYLPFDVDESRLKELLSVMRHSRRVLGINVTVPHKLAVMKYLDEVDPAAARIESVNTVARTANGRLVGYNTDGEGFIESILRAQPGEAASFMASLADMNVLLLGAGGSARAVAMHVAELLNRGELVICNRTMDRAEALAVALRKIGRRARAVPEAELSLWAPGVGLIINSTTKGQGGDSGKLTGMEAYSALAPAHPAPAAEPQDEKPDTQQNAPNLSEAEIQQNRDASLKLAAAVPKSVRFYDLIYFPEETVFLRHARLTGHRTMNGKGMLINQAAIGFCRRICRAELQAKGIDNPNTYREVLDAMYSAW